MSLSTARAAAAGLRRAARRAPAIVVEHTGTSQHLPALRDVPVSVLTRVGWAEMAGRSIAHLIPATSSSIKARLYTEEIGVGLSVAAPRILGQFDPFAGGDQGRGRLLLVAPNVWSFTSTWNLDARDVQLYVSIHEYVHALQYIVAPWLTDYMSELAREIFAGRMEAVDRISALMAVLEGHAEYVTNRVPVRSIPSIYRIRSAMAGRRISGSVLQKVIQKIVGADAKIAQYTTGAAFIEAVMAGAGRAGVNRLWEGPGHLPTHTEIEEPQAWMTRVLS